MNTTFDSYDDALEAHAQINTLRDDVMSKLFEWRELAAKVPSVNPKELEHLNNTMDDMLASFADCFDGHQKQANRELDENPWLREVAGDCIWREAGQ